MDLNEFKKARKKYILKSIFNNTNLLILVLLFIVIFISRSNKNVYFALVLIFIVLFFELIAFILEYISIKDIYLYKNKLKSFKYDGILYDKNKLIDMVVEKGIPSTYLEINKKIYCIEVARSGKKYVIFIDYDEYSDINEIKKFITRSTSKKIKILMVNGENPSNYFK